MVIDAVKEINTNDVLNYIKSCDLISIREGKNTKSIYFKDNDHNYTVFIYSLLNNSATVLATVSGISFNSDLSREVFYNLFNKYKMYRWCFYIIGKIYIEHRSPTFRGMGFFYLMR